MLPCVAVCCNFGCACCSVLKCVAVCCSVLQFVAVCCSVLQCVAISVVPVASLERGNNLDLGLQKMAFQI